MAGIALLLWGAASRAEDLLPSTFRPDREAPVRAEPKSRAPLVFTARPGRAYPVVGRTLGRRWVRIASLASTQGWVRAVPAELVEPLLPFGPLGELSPGWSHLYRSLDPKMVDTPLEAALRAMNSGAICLGYDAARTYMYSSIDPRAGRLRCVYTGLEFPAGPRPGSGPNGESMNTEHTWPQGQFGKREPMKSDLHHLFPTEVQANGTRGSKPFSELDDGEGEPVGPIGARTTEDRFETPPDHKGNVARAIFYMAVQYSFDVPAAEEAVLRTWHRDDPPDASEKGRLEAIYQLQRSRNWFVDQPGLVDRIKDF